MRTEATDGLLDEIEPAVAAMAQVHPNGVPSEHLRDRLDRAVDLYRAGTVR